MRRLWIGLLTAALGGATTMGSPAGAQPTATVNLTTPTTVRAVELLADGDRLEVGHFGGRLSGCLRGNRGFIRRLDPRGAVRWTRSHGGAAEASCTDGGAGLFAAWPADPAHLVSSQIFDVAVDPWTGNIATTGEVVVAEIDINGAPALSRSAFVAVVDGAGGLLASRFFGDGPRGAAPPQTPCPDLCQGCRSPGLQAGGRAVAWVGGDVVAAGWRLATAPAPNGSLLTRLDGADLSTVWQASTVEAAVLDAEVDATGRILVTGHIGPLRDVWVAAYSAGGALEASFQSGGDLDDEGTAITVEARGIRVRGRFSDEITFGLTTLGEPGGGARDFTAWFDPWLDVLAAESPAAPPSALLASTAGLSPVGLDIQSGVLRAGDVAELDGAGAVRLLPDAATGAVAVEVPFHPGDAPGLLTRVTVQLGVKRCARLRLAARGLGDLAATPLVDERLCTEDAPTVTVDLPPDLSAALGFDNVTAPHPDDRLVLALKLDFATSACTARPEPDSSIEQISVDIDWKVWPPKP
ncbi:MAG: hypothetical protein AAGF23_17320 [Acidobacteriota bacterium]